MKIILLLKIFGVSKYGHNHAETMVVVRTAVVVESEHASIGRVVAVATTIEERTVGARKARAVV